MTSKKEILYGVLQSFFALVTNIRDTKATKSASFAFLISKAIVKTRMASEDVNYTSSSDSEDSEVNFIIDYVLEVEGSSNSSDQDGEDLDKELEAYADEPLADDEWMAIYEDERKADEELEKRLQNRLNGTEEVSKWLVVVAINTNTQVSTHIHLSVIVG